MRIGNGTSTGELRYTGAGGDSTDRTIQIGNGTNTGGAIITNNGAGALTFTAATFNAADAAATSARTLTLQGSNGGEIQGIIQDNAVTGTVAVTKDGAGTLTLSATSAQTGNTTVNNGTYRLGAGNVLPDTLGMIVAAGALDTNGVTDKIGGLTLGGGSTGTATVGGSGTVKLGSNVTYTSANNAVATIGSGLDLDGADRTFTINNGTNVVDLKISGPIANTGGGNMAMGNAGGRLLLSGNNSGFTGTGGGTTAVEVVTVEAGGTLGGNGTVGDGTATATVQTGGFLSPGTSPGTLTFKADLTMNNGATLVFAGGDLVAVQNQLDLDDNWTLQLGTGFVDGGTTVLFTYGTLAATPDLAPTFDTSGLGFTPSGSLTLTNDSGNSRIVLNGIQLVPEPGTGLLLLVGLAAGMMARRRRAY